VKVINKDSISKAVRGEFTVNTEIEEVWKKIKAEQTHGHQGYVSESDSAEENILPNETRHQVSPVPSQSGHSPYPESDKLSDIFQDLLSKENQKLLSRRFEALHDLSPLINASWRLAQQTMIARLLHLLPRCNTCNDLMACSEKAEGILGTRLKVDIRMPCKKPEENPFCCNDGPFGSLGECKPHTCSNDPDDTGSVKGENV
jgi:hypothetical protein